MMEEDIKSEDISKEDVDNLVEEKQVMEDPEPVVEEKPPVVVKEEVVSKKVKKEKEKVEPKVEDSFTVSATKPLTRDPNVYSLTIRKGDLVFLSSYREKGTLLQLRGTHFKYAIDITPEEYVSLKKLF